MIMKLKPFHIKAVLFDFDGTLTRPGALDFSVIKEKLGCPLDAAVLEYIENLPDARQRNRARSELDRFEEEGAEDSRPNPGAEALIHRLKAIGIQVGLITRNSRRSVMRALENFDRVRASDFEVLISRDDPIAPKPEPDGILHAAGAFGVNAREIMVVGDFVFDIQAGLKAGAVTVFLNNGSGHVDGDSDFTISALSDLEEIVGWGRPLKPGKLPQPLLERFLADCDVSDDSVLVRPGVGEDTAAVDLAGAEVLVLTSDPITFATDAIGRYAVVVNANDMATSGAIPRWLLTTLLFPAGVTPSEIGHTMQELARTCRKWGITLCGGHTEITDAVTRPVVIGTMSGTVSRENLIDKRNMKPGDRILLTKGVAVEGTAIIAREFADRLRELGMTDAEVDRCKEFLERLSVVPEARIAAGYPETSVLHDITEGGLATALEEMSIAGGYGIRVFGASIPVFSETEKICRLMGMDPLGLIGSGSLLIGCRNRIADALLERLHEAGIAAAVIGEVLDERSGILAEKGGKPMQWPQFEVDEIARLFSQAGKKIE